jgi:hypothetical protein
MSYFKELMELNLSLVNHLKNISILRILLMNPILIYKRICRDLKKRNLRGEIAAGCVRVGARSSLSSLITIQTLPFIFHLKSINLDKSLNKQIKTHIIEWYLQVHIDSIFNTITKEYFQNLIQRVMKIMI